MFHLVNEKCYHQQKVHITFTNLETRKRIYYKSIQVRGSTQKLSSNCMPVQLNVIVIIVFQLYRGTYQLLQISCAICRIKECLPKDNCLFCYMNNICMQLSLLGRYFHYFYQRKRPCLLFDVDMRILIDKALKHFYISQESLILCKHENICLSFTLKQNTCLYCIHSVKIPTKKGVNSYKHKLSKIGNL